MRYCILCGIPLTQQLQEKWLKEFRAVWTEDDKWPDIKLSGIGARGEYDDEVTGTAPVDCRKRYDDPLDPDSLIDVALSRSNMELFVHPERLRFEPEPFWGFGFHSSCWGIFTTGYTPNLPLLFEACLSMPLSMASTIMNWGHDYGGATAVQITRGLPKLVSRFSRLSSIPLYMRSDPLDIPTISKAIKYSVRLENDIFRSSLGPGNLEGDKFSCLSLEMLQLIAILLPTHDVHSLRLASPVFARLSLSERFWASRFQEGNEFDHLFEVLDNSPESWRSLYLSLLIWARDNPNLTNRRRVWILAKQLQATLRQMESTPCNGTSVKTWYEPHGDQENIPYKTAARNITPPEESFFNGCRVLRSRSVRLGQPLELQTMSVSFINTSGGKFVSGLVFVEDNGKRHTLGYLHPYQSVHVQVPVAQRIQGWQLALDISGIRAIAVITGNGKISSWAGEPGNFARWHLGEAESIFAVKAEFDALKMISLSRNTSCDVSVLKEWRSNCLWYPQIPPEHMFFNHASGNQPPRKFSVPITTLFFGGVDGQYLCDLTEIVVWTFDISRIVGIEFLYINSSQNRYLGHVGPFGDDYPVLRRFDPPESQEHRLSMSIDGPGGEQLRSIEAQLDGGSLVGLKIQTNFGRELTSPQCPFAIEKDWVIIQPDGSRVVGLFSSYGHFLFNIGLISANLGVNSA